MHGTRTHACIITCSPHSALTQCAPMLSMCAPVAVATCSSASDTE